MFGDYEMDRNLKDLRLFYQCDLFNELKQARIPQARINGVTSQLG